MLTREEIQLIFQLIEEKYGRGYSDNPQVARLQVKLSILLELEAKRKESQWKPTNPRQCGHCGGEPAQSFLERLRNEMDKWMEKLRFPPTLQEAEELANDIFAYQEELKTWM